jgi:hypothetical protein
LPSTPTPSRSKATAAIRICGRSPVAPASLPVRTWRTFSPPPSAARCGPSPWTASPAEQGPKVPAWRPSR